MSVCGRDRWERITYLANISELLDAVDGTGTTRVLGLAGRLLGSLGVVGAVMGAGRGVNVVGAVAGTAGVVDAGPVGGILSRGVSCEGGWEMVALA